MKHRRTFLWLPAGRFYPQLARVEGMASVAYFKMTVPPFVESSVKVFPHPHTKVVGFNSGWIPFFIFAPPKE
jgi:hypothetical protein